MQQQNQYMQQQNQYMQQQQQQQQQEQLRALPAPPNAPSSRPSSRHGRSKREGSSGKSRKHSSRSSDRRRSSGGSGGRREESSREKSRSSRGRKHGSRSREKDEHQMSVGQSQSQNHSQNHSQSQSRSQTISQSQSNGKSRNHKLGRGSTLDSTISTKSQLQFHDNNAGIINNPHDPRFYQRELSPPKYPNRDPNNQNNPNVPPGTTVSQFLSQQRHHQDKFTSHSQSNAQYKAFRQEAMVREIETATGGEIITRRMTEVSEAVSDLGDSFQTLETTLIKAGKQQHANNGSSTANTNGDGSNHDGSGPTRQLVKKEKHSDTRKSPSRQPVVDAVPADHPSSNIIQTHRTCTLCHRDLPRSQFSTQDRYTVHLSLAPGAVCRTCSMTVSAVRLKCLPSMERLLIEYGERGGELVEANARYRDRLREQKLLESSDPNAGALVSLRGSEITDESGSGGSNNGSVTGRELVPVGVQSVYSSSIVKSRGAIGNPNNAGNVTNINGIFSSDGTSNYLAQEDRPTHIADCKYIDLLFSMPCYPKLNSLGLFSSSRDVSVSVAALEAVRLYGTLDPSCFVGHDQFGERMDNRQRHTNNSNNNRNRGSETTDATALNGNNIDPKSIVCLVLGEGRTPRTAVLASQHYGWTALSIDPNLADDWDGHHHDTLPGFTGYAGSISEFMDNPDEHTETMIAYSNPDRDGRVEHLVIIGVQMKHDQIRLRDHASINDIRARYQDVPTTLISMSPVRKARLAPKRKEGQATSALERDVGYEPNCSYVDEGVFSACRFVEVWNFHNADDDDEDYYDDDEESYSGSEYTGSEDYTRSEYSGTYGDSYTDTNYDDSYMEGDGESGYHDGESHGEGSTFSTTLTSHDDGRPQESHQPEGDRHHEVEKKYFYDKGESWYDRDEERHENPPALPPSQHGDLNEYDQYQQHQDQQGNDNHEDRMNQDRGESEQQQDDLDSTPSSRHSRRSRSRTRNLNQKERIAKESRSNQRRSTLTRESKDTSRGHSGRGSGSGTEGSYDSRSYTEGDSRFDESGSSWTHGEGGSSYADGQESRGGDFDDHEQSSDNRGHRHDHGSQYSDEGHGDQDEGSYYSNSIRDEQSSSGVFSNYTGGTSERQSSRKSASSGHKHQNQEDVVLETPEVSNQSTNPFEDDQEDDADRGNQDENRYDSAYNNYHEEQYDQLVDTQRNEEVWEQAMAKHEKQDSFVRQFEDYYEERGELPREVVDDQSCPLTSSDSSLVFEEKEDEDAAKRVSNADMSGSESFYVYGEDDESENSGLAALNRWNNNIPTQPALGRNDDIEEYHLDGWSDDEDAMGELDQDRRERTGVPLKQRPWANSAGNGDSFYSYGD
ncbi:hypothetical protein ACHAXS_005577 [Conticribra weissflogii]